MQREFTEAEAAHHNSLTRRGWELTEGSLHVHGTSARGRPGWLARQKLRQAIRCFERALEINPEGWSSMWALGKIYQRLGEHETSLSWFIRAHEVNPDQSDVAREAALAALGSGAAALAVQLCVSALRSKPGDVGLLANLALAHMLNRDDVAALDCAVRAGSADASDEVSRNVLRYVEDVAQGRRPRPTKLQDVLLD
jgi:Flp pilus assembly protein TadD